jgi:uncharacterized protein (DUF2267 family)
MVPGKRRTIMESRELIDAVRTLDFIPDAQTADAVVKAVLGILASSVDHSMAQNLASVLPEPLDYDRLRGHQAKPVAITPERYIMNVVAQFGLQEDQARRAIVVVLEKARDAVRNNEIKIIIETLLYDLGRGR